MGVTGDRIERIAAEEEVRLGGLPPRPAIAGDEEVDLLLLLVAKVVEAEGAVAGVGPVVARLEQMTGHQVLETRSGLGTSPQSHR